MSKKQITVSDLAALIEAREETRAELQQLTLCAFEHWRELDAKIKDLEERFAHSYDDFAEARNSASTVGHDHRS